MTATREYLTPRYLERFQCIGPACEDTCCRGWTIAVDKTQFEKLRDAMSTTRDERDRFKRSLKTVPPDARRPGLHATLQPRNDGSCAFLDADALCSVQRTYGEDPMPNVCASYPRSLRVTDVRTEEWASLSCPETARLCLLADDAVDLVDRPAIKGSRGFVKHARPIGATDPYDVYLDDIRIAGLQLLSMNDHPLALRLHFLASFAARTAPFFHRGTTCFDEARLGRELTLASLPEAHAAWTKAFLAPAPLAPAMQFVLEMLRERLHMTATTPFHRLVVEVLLAQPSAPAAPSDPGAVVDVVATPSELAASLERRRAHWETHHGERITQFFANYARDAWLKEWYTASTSLVDHVNKLIVRIAMLRVLVLCHPRLAASEGAGAEEERRVLDETAVEVVYKFSRAIDHDAKFLARLNAAFTDAPFAEVARLLLHL